jgi:hypothetical protein
MWVSLLLCPAALSTLGCAGTDRLKKQVAGLETQVTSMRADQDRLEERLAAVELSTAPAKASDAPAPERVEHQRLKVIHLAPDDGNASSNATPEAPASSGAAPTGASDPNAHRPIIRGTGDRVIKVGDGDGSDESTRADGPVMAPLASLGRDSRRN